MVKPRLLNLVLAILLLAASATTVCAQVTGTISGRVEDEDGAAVAGGTVTGKNIETGSQRVATTDDAGNFRAVSLQVGRQEVKAEKQNFKTAIRSAINL